MKFYGDLDLNQNLLKNVSFENTTEFPASPKAGQTVFKGKKLYLCAEISNEQPVWIPLTNEIDTLVHEQAVASLLWDITHTFDDNTVTVQVFASDGTVILPDGIDTSVAGHIKISFGVAQAGKAMIIHRIFAQSDLGSGTGGSGGGGGTSSGTGSLRDLTGVADWVLGFDGSVSGTEDLTDPYPGSGDTWNGNGCRLSASKFVFFSSTVDVSLPGAVAPSRKYMVARATLADSSSVGSYVLSDSLGFPNDSTEFWFALATYKYDAEWNQINYLSSVISFTGAQAQTVEAFITMANGQLDSAFASFALVNGVISLTPVDNTWEEIQTVRPSWYSGTDPVSGSFLADIMSSPDLNINSNGLTAYKLMGELTAYLYDVNVDNTVTLLSQTPLFVENSDDLIAMAVDESLVVIALNDTNVALVRVNVDNTVEVLDQMVMSYSNGTTLAQLTSTTFAACHDNSMFNGTGNPYCGGLQLFSVVNNALVKDDFISIYRRLESDEIGAPLPTVGDFTPPNDIDLTSISASQCARLDDTHVLVFLPGKFNQRDAEWVYTVQNVRGYAFVVDTTNLTVSAPIVTYDALDQSGQGFSADDPNCLTSLGGGKAVFTAADMNNGDFMTAVGFIYSAGTLTVGAPTVVDARDSYYNHSACMLGDGQALVATDTGYYDSDLDQSFDRITTVAIKVEADGSVVAGTPVDWAPYNNYLSDPARLVGLDGNHAAMMYEGQTSDEIIIPRILYQA